MVREAKYRTCYAGERIEPDPVTGKTWKYQKKPISQMMFRIDIDCQKKMKKEE